jgi:hypothetical protein
MSTEREREKKRNRIVVFLITCKFLIPDESTRKNKSLTMNWIDRDQQQIQLGFLIIHACNSIINIKKAEELPIILIHICTCFVD